MKLKVKRLDLLNSYLPTKNFNSDAGFDLYAAEDVTLKKNVVIKVKTNICLELDENIQSSSIASNPYYPNKIANNHFGLVCDRSSLGSLGIKTLGCVIDQNYRGEITICLIKLTKKKYKIKKGDKIAQIIYIPLVDIDEIEETEELSETDRNSDGFGSSGK